MTTMELLAPETVPPSALPRSGGLERLAEVHSDRPLIVSLYLRLEVQDRIRQRYRIAVRDAVRKAVDAVGLAEFSHSDREALLRDLERVRSYADTPGKLPPSPGLALFACESLKLFEVVPLPRVLHTRLALGDRPRLAEALAAMENLGRIVVAVVDRTHARLFEVTAGESRELSGLALPATRGGKFHSDRADSPGWGERSFHSRIREERHRHAAAVAGQLAVLVAERPCRGIVLAGPVRTTAELQRFLPRSLAGQLLGTARLNPTAVTAAEVRRAALEVHAAAARAHAATVIAELTEATGEGWAVNGVGPTLRALARGGVRMLIIPAGESGQGYRCQTSGRLVLARNECRQEGEAVLVPDLIGELVDEALRQHIEVEVIEDPALRERVDGLAALLRFR